MAQRLLQALRIARATPEGLLEFSGTERLLERRDKYRLEHERDGIFSLCFSPDGSLVLIGYGDGSIQVVERNTVSLIKELRIGHVYNFPVTMICIHPLASDEVCASSADGKVYACNIKLETCAAILTEPNNEINCLDFCFTGEKFATAGRDRAVRVYDATSLQVKGFYAGLEESIPPAEVIGHSSRIYALKYHPAHRNVFLTAGWDKIVGIWDDRTTAGMQRHVYGPYITGDGLDVTDDRILTASWTFSDALQLWDLGGCGLIENLPFKYGRNGTFLYSCRFYGRNIVMAGGSGTNSVQAVGLKTRKVLTEMNFKQPVFTIDVSKTSQSIAVGGASRKMLLYKLAA